MNLQILNETGSKKKNYVEYYILYLLHIFLFVDICGMLQLLFDEREDPIIKFTINHWGSVGLTQARGMSILTSPPETEIEAYGLIVESWTPFQTFLLGDPSKYFPRYREIWTKTFTDNEL